MILRPPLTADQKLIRRIDDLHLDASVPRSANPDQGGQFTSTAFTETVLDRGIRVSMDG